MMLVPDGYTFAIAADHASVDDQLQRTNAFQQERPLHQKLDGAAGRQLVGSLEQNTAAADIQRSAQTKPFHSTFAEHLVFNFQRDGVSAIHALVNSTLL